MGVTLSVLAAFCAPALAQSGSGNGTGGGNGSGSGGSADGGAGGGGSGNGTGTYTLQISPGVSLRSVTTLPNGQVRAQRNGGAGNEQPTVDMLGDTVVVAYVSSNVANGPQNQVSQIKCSSVKMNANGVPTIVADQVPLENWPANRRGTPSLSCEPTTGRCLLAYGANNVNGNNNTQTEALVVDANCKDLTGGPSHHVRLNANQNNNEAAPKSVFDASQNVHIFGYYANNDATYGEMVQIVPGTNSDGGTYTVKQLTQPQRLINSNIGRMSIVLMPGQHRALYAACAGQNRPCPQGNQVSYLDTDIADIKNNAMPVLWKQTLLKASPDPNNVGGTDGLPGPLGGQGVYPARPQLVLGDNGEVIMSSWISDGAGHRRNSKGSSTNHVLVFKPDDTGPNVGIQSTGVALESNHIGACSAQVGTVGSEQRVAAVFGEPETGFGAASLSFVMHDANAFSLHSAAAVSPSDADGAYLSNMLGENPNTQGSGHPVCMGDVPNVGYGVSGGFMPHVKTFILAPWTGRKGWGSTAPMVMAANGKMLPEDRNALYLTFVAGVRDAVQPPPAPPAPTPAPVATGGGGGGSGGSTGGNAGTPGTPGTPGSPGSFSSGCSVAFGGAESSTGLGMMFLGLALLLVTRRRWS